jgi:mono/diheme cytochrome c family protein
MSPNETQTQRRDTEPTVGFSAVPIWLIVLLGLFAFWGETYLDNHAGGFNAKVYQPYENYAAVEDAQPHDPRQIALIAGRKLFEPNCGACHQVDGMGAAGKAPPLVGSEWVLAPKPDRIIRIVLDGLSGPVEVKGQEWNLNMVPWRSSFKDEDIANILSYVRNSWGNKAAMVTAAQVKEIREKTKAHTIPWTAPDLKSVTDR